MRPDFVPSIEGIVLYVYSIRSQLGTKVSLYGMTKCELVELQSLHDTATNYNNSTDLLVFENYVKGLK